MVLLGRQRQQIKASTYVLNTLMQVLAMQITAELETMSMCTSKCFMHLCRIAQLRPVGLPLSLCV